MVCWLQQHSCSVTTKDRSMQSNSSRHAVVQFVGEEGADGLKELRGIDVLGWYGSKGGAEMAAGVARERQARPEATCLPMRGVVVVWDEVRVKAAELALMLAGN